MSIARRITLLALIATLVVSTGMASTGSTELTITKARIDFAKKAGRDTLQLSVAFDPDLLSPSIPPHQGQLTVTIGPETVISLPDFAGRGKWQVKEKKGIYKFRRKRTKKHPDTLDMKVNVVKGVMKLTADRLDLSDLQGEGPDEVAFAVTVSGATCAKTVKMGQRDLRWRYRYTTKGKVNPKGLPGGGGGGGGGSGLPGDGPVSIRILNQGSHPGLTTYNTTVIRTQQAYTTEWFKRYPPPPPGLGMPVMAPPTVDWSTEMVVIIDLGTRPSAGYGVNLIRATATGQNLKVDWVENQPGANCVVATVITYPFVIGAVARRTGAVTFNGSVKTVNCR